MEERIIQKYLDRKHSSMKFKILKYFIHLSCIFYNLEDPICYCFLCPWRCHLTLQLAFLRIILLTLDVISSFSGNLETNGAWDYTHCIVNYKGEVLCVPSLKWSARCIANLQQWPFDQHTCSMTVGSWSQTGEQMNLKPHSNGVSILITTAKLQLRFVLRSILMLTQLCSIISTNTWPTHNKYWSPQWKLYLWITNVLLMNNVWTILSKK